MRQEITQLMMQMLKGEGAIIPGFLAETSAALALCRHSSDSTFVPTITALHSLYTSLHALSTGRIIDTSVSDPELTPHLPNWEQSTEEVLQTVAGTVSPRP